MKITIEGIRKKVRTSRRLDWYTEALRNISPYFDWVFLNLGLTANQVTLLSFIPIIVGSSLFLFADPVYWIVSWIVMQLYCVLDCSDGEVARYNNNMTKFGGLLDEFMHPMINAVVLVFATLGLFIANENIIVLVLGISATFFILANRVFKLTFALGEIPKEHIGGNIVPLGGLIHIFVLPAVLDLLVGGIGFRSMALVFIGVVMPIVFMSKIASIYRKRGGL